MSNFLQRFFSRTRVELKPRAISGREAAWAPGYSLLELERAGISEEQATAAGITIDRRRNSALGTNVIQLERLRASNGWRK